MAKYKEYKAKFIQVFDTKKKRYAKVSRSTGEVVSYRGDGGPYLRYPIVSNVEVVNGRILQHNSES